MIRGIDIEFNDVDEYTFSSIAKLLIKEGAQYKLSESGIHNWSSEKASESKIDLLVEQNDLVGLTKLPVVADSVVVARYEEKPNQKHIDTYKDYLESNSTGILFVWDMYYYEVYLKKKAEIFKWRELLKGMACKYELVTDENDQRTAFHVW